jgi:hypothetical protein
MNKWLPIILLVLYALLCLSALLMPVDVIVKAVGG